MAGASDKARFYLERSVPELHELLRKKLFTEQEITSIAKTRSDFEHKVNARGSRPVDWARYAQYEMNLESLRQRRIKRKGLKNSGHTGQRRIFFILDRATKKFSGDIGLWMQYIEFARKQKANKKLSQILTAVLRLHPTNPDLWIYAANYALDERSDIAESRSCMQRGLRFCKGSRQLWCEYAKLEMMYISKIHARGRILGLQRPDNDKAGFGDDTVDIPRTIDNETGSEAFEYIDEEILEKLQGSPALSGAIPIAIIESAMKQFAWDSALGKELFDTVASFRGVPCVAKILRHIVQGLQSTTPSSPATMSCFFKEPTLSDGPVSAGFPAALRSSLDRLKISVETLSASSNLESTARSRSILAREVINWILDLHTHDVLDQDVTKVLLAILKKTWNQFIIDLEMSPGINAHEFSEVLETLQKKEFKGLAASGVIVGLRLWPEHTHLLAIQRAAITWA
ncbi:MAG: U3 snoRNP protein [Heterodermia speciosa]|uniref:U3 snoRNP protein n=1 Tax=Heterodermia speciosa TaxID=116794 RepID=A0A8H3F6G9_9LECA|nr:MAG: U3 snoRNP protein [Heterodermia speciosa]